MSECRALVVYDPGDLFENRTLEAQLQDRSAYVKDMTERIHANHQKILRTTLRLNFHKDISPILNEIRALEKELLGSAVAPSPEESEKMLNQSAEENAAEHVKQVDAEADAKRTANKTCKALYKQVQQLCHSDKTEDPNLQECFTLARRLLIANDTEGMQRLAANVLHYIQVSKVKALFKNFLKRRINALTQEGKRLNYMLLDQISSVGWQIYTEDRDGLTGAAVRTYSTILNDRLMQARAAVEAKRAASTSASTTVNERIRSTSNGFI